MGRSRATLLVACGALLAALGAARGSAAEPPGLPRRLLNEASSWAYQLQDARVADLGRTAYDVIVIDAFFGGDPAAIAALKKKPLGGRRLVLAYLSIGQAEVYRYYWQRCCKGRDKPQWLGPEDKQWPGNFAVDYWHDDWKAIIYAGEGSYLKRIVDSGFDGVLLDRVDVYGRAVAKGPTARTEMIALVRGLAEKARSLKPGFLVVPLNGEELADDEAYLSLVDAVAKEDLLFGDTSRSAGPVPVSGRNDEQRIAKGVGLLKRVSAAGKPVFVVEYLQDAKLIAQTRVALQEFGFVPYFAPRGLERLQVEDLADDDSH